MVYILQISDIHIHGPNNKRIMMAIEEIKRQFSHLNPIIVIAGDTFHLKEKVTGENIDTFIRILDILSLFAKKIIIILGNHDFIDDKPSYISSIMAIYKNDKVLYCPKSGPINLSELEFYVLSPLDFRGTVSQLQDIKELKSKVKFGIMHDQIPAKYITKELLSNFTYVLSGHLHDHQEIFNCIYSGALIQLSEDEKPEKGLVLWTISSDSVKKEFIPLYVPGTVLKFDLVNEKNISFAKLLPESIISRIDILVQDIQDPRINTIKSHFSISMIPKISVILMNKVYLETDIDSELLQSPILNDLRTKTVDIFRKKINTTWSLSFLEFSNLFCHGPYNYINWESMTGISGIIGENGKGKSSIIDILTLALFNQMTRSNIKNIFRKGTDKSYVRCLWKAGKTTYLVERVWFSSTGKESNKFTIDGIVQKQTTVAEMYKTIESIIGTMDDFISIPAMTQHMPVSFINLRDQDRRELFSRILGQDKLQDLEKEIAENYKFLGREIKGIVTELESLDSIEDNSEILNLVTKDYNKILDEIRTLEKEVPVKRPEIKDLEKEKKRVSDFRQQVISGSLQLTAENKRSFPEPRLKAADIRRELRDIVIENYASIKTLEDAKKFVKVHKEVIDMATLALPIAKEYESLTEEIIGNIDETEEFYKAQIVKGQKNYNPNVPIQCRCNGKKYINDDQKNFKIHIPSDIMSLDRNKTIEKMKELLSLENNSENKLMFFQYASHYYGNYGTNDKIFDIVYCLDNHDTVTKNRDYYDKIELYKKKLNFLKKRTLEQSLSKMSQDIAKKIGSINKIFSLAELQKIIRGHTISYSLACEVLADEKEIIQADINRKRKAELEKLLDQRIEWDRIEERKQQIQKDISIYESRLAESELEYNKLVSENSKYDIQLQEFQKYENSRIRLDLLRKEQLSLGSKREVLIAQVTRAQVIKKRTIELEDRLKGLNAKKKIYETYKYAIGNREGIQAKNEAKNIGLIEKEINKHYFSMTSMNVSITGNHGDIKINVQNGQSIFPAINCSGFQQTILDIIIRIVLLTCALRPMPKFLIIDEGLGTLDTQNRDLIIDRLPGLSMNLQFMFLVTHMPEMQSIMKDPILINGPIQYGIPLIPRLTENLCPIKLRDYHRESQLYEGFKAGKDGTFICLLCDKVIRQQKRHIESKGHIQKYKNN